MKSILFLSIVLMLFSISDAVSQTMERRFIVNGNVALPAGGYEDYGLKTDIGFGLSGDYLIPLSAEGLILVSSAGVFLNKMDASRLDYFNPGYFGHSYSRDAEAGHWVNLPVMTGLGLKREITTSLELYGAVQLGFDMIFAPDIDFTGNARNTKDKFDNAVAFGYALTGSLLINSRTNIALRYYGFGEPTINHEYTITDDIYYSRAKWPISLLCIQIGYCF